MAETISNGDKFRFKDKLAQELARAGAIDPKIIAQAIEVRENESATRRASGERRSQRNLAQILVKDFNVTHDAYSK